MGGKTPDPFLTTDRRFGVDNAMTMQLVTMQLDRLRKERSDVDIQKAGPSDSYTSWHPR